MRSIVSRVEVHGIAGADPIARRAGARLTAMLNPLSIRPTSAEIRFTDENGPTGGDDVRCALAVKVPRHGQVYVEEVAASPRIAFDAAAGKLERRLVRLSESDRDRRRHPKKYFVAAQAWH